MTPEHYGPAQTDSQQNFCGLGMFPSLILVDIEALAADADITDRLIKRVPAGYTLTILQADLISHGSAVGIDDDNTCVVTLKNGTNTIVSKTYKTDPAYPAAETADSLGDLSAVYQKIAAAGTLKYSVVNGTAANPPACTIQLLVCLDQAF